jgi:cytochrome c biogenesis protein CcmG/thiol:disulfide interchange protein DsbE
MRTVVAAAVIALALGSYEGPTLASPTPTPSAEPSPAGASIRATATPEPPVLGPVPGLYMNDFTLKSIDGATVTLHEIPGKALVVNFFATWCPPCQEETAAFVKVAGDLRSRGIAFVAVDDNERLEAVQRFATARHVNTYPILLDDGDKVGFQLGIADLPTTIIVGSDGIVRYVRAGGMSEADLNLAISAASDQVVAPSQLDVLDRDGIAPLSTYTFDLKRNDGTATSQGTMKIDVFSRAFDYLSVRAVEVWTGETAERRYLGTISPDGALDFGTQSLDAAAVALFSFFSKHLGSGHDVAQSPQWRQTRSSQKTTVATDLTLTAVDGRSLSFRAVGLAIPVDFSTADPIRFDAEVVYDSGQSIPVSGAINSDGKTITFALRRR